MSAPAIAAERIKFSSLRPLTWMLWLGIISLVGTAWLLGASAKASGDNGFDTYTPAPELVFSTLQLAQLFFATAAACASPPSTPQAPSPPACRQFRAAACSTLPRQCSCSSPER
ncbi:hypothetical protein [Arthrobacter sp. JCM 19049]|uniref:hypothetical protein n=1 Tax=Arthrobacter sp. JCM 19049 TaxID=1460643 RepID=UPI0006D22FA8|nr:hypothetical protein [Arthrobacter sp. JCM 19049]